MTDTTTRPSTTAAIERLRAGLAGRVVTADDPDYDVLRVVMVGGIDARPAAIARVADADDVALVITVARESGLELAVRSGGHSGAGHSTVEDGLVVDLRDLDSLDIDVDGRTAWAGAGLTAGAYTTAVGAHGLATGFGDTGSVGLGGITLGGGVASTA
jgi:FAD/FMN-containing dehydrogenase